MNVSENVQNAPGASRLWTLPAIIAAFLCLCVTGAFAETRALKIQHLHTGEKAEIVFKRNGRYDPAGLKKINLMLRDWRRNEPTKMDPRLLDLVWQAYRASGSRAYIHVVSAYRSPATNAMLRSRSKGVARESQHMVGRAMDFFLPDVPLKKLRDIGLKMQGGGVGYYPTSGSPFIHMDVGNVRHWPGISRQELARVFPNGNTLHVPSDGKPLPGYGQAFAAYKSRKGAGTPNIDLASADGGQRRPARGLLATLLGGRGADETDDVAEAVPAPRKPAKSVEPRPAGIAIVPPQDAQRADIQMASVDRAEESPIGPEGKTPEAIVMAMAPGSVPLPAFAPRSGSSIPTPQLAPLAAANASTARAELANPTATDAEIPSGKSAGPAGGAPDMVAFNIPLPTWRPESPTRQLEADKSGDAVAALLALNHADDGHNGLAGQRVSVAQSKPEDRVRTSPKADRVQPNLDPEATAVIVPAALSRPIETGRGIAGGASTAAAPVIAANLIRTAPEHIYLDGFQPRGQTSDHRRFTGSAVKFLPIASFK
ncbi:MULTISPECIES: DUF882 domain-containing protein [unclassified Mesorhizobium]|uniref:DUF882 domain-containing protein n=1 Tax=unclassified Mesorhizobium TaxID=325217 RepID=UPI000FCA21D3|nr:MULTISPECIES: DUF882 domain-containing protein [unclassified Mesorhizobium]RUU58118.1 DUF882 domain-containing protein [Mesorhizobium sp. M7A.T.Ca.TU.009.01.1.1]RUU85219.1 DUF882 domain-containing protein [Mesorhizobium sp. M7A.T.Ca.TU.009.01.1.2]RUV53759.1 DUF882 domain-containing protein [Mesorhizobium sp. M7A.F.Ca.MR.228.00.0.0]RUT87280.1 DUF882 domain-containing protein [Mesorhizobium sp. M7A.T.Ca.US.000.02.1.1]RUT93882.1 DUF882 domain-containing protein [Mesorhizobium sp. M7A.T.Ca.US.0